MSDLPEGWAKATMGSLCRLENGRAFKPSDWTTNGLPIVRIQNLNNPNAPFNHYAGEVDERYRLRGGELLFAWSGTPGTSFGAHIWHGNDAVLNQHIFRVDFDEQALDKQFFRQAINQKLDELIEVAHGGVGLRHVTKGVFENTEVVVPPLNEQKRIAAELDILLAQVDLCRERLYRVSELIKRFRQAVLGSATSGELTEEWREENKSDAPVDVVLADYATDVNYGTSAKSSVSGIIPVLRMGNIQNGCLDWNNLVYTSDPIEIKKYTLRPGDVLFNRTNSPELVGKTALFKGEQQAIFAGYLVRFRCTDQLLPDYINYCLNSPEGRNYCWRVKSDGVSQSNINAQKLLGFRFLLPSLPEQQEIVRCVENLFDFADRLEARLKATRNAVDRVVPAILTKAFRGELVPQDTNDEPASILLERIQHARAEQQRAPRTPSAKRTKVVAKTLQEIKSTHLTDTLLANGGKLSPEELLRLSELTLDDFYTQIKKEMKTIRDVRPDEQTRFLEAIS